MKRSSLAEGVRLVRRLVERLIYVYVGASGNGNTSCCQAAVLRTVLTAAAYLIANASPRGQCQVLHVTCRVEVLEGKAPYSSEYTADTVRDSRQGVVLQLGLLTPLVVHVCKMLHVDLQSTSDGLL
jgi:hypothetical protein